MNIRNTCVDITKGIAIILMVIILSSIILAVNKTSETKDAMRLNNDIEELSRRVNLYYFKNGTIPIDKQEVAPLEENGFKYYKH